MISSEDVRRVTFERGMRGYRCEDVDDYLKRVADVMDDLSAQAIDMQNKMHILGERINQYRSEEDTLRTTMINAQRMGENVIKEAKQKAAETIRAANIKAEDREQRARDEVELAQQEVVTLKREADAFKKMLLAKYREHVELISKFPEYSENAQSAAEPEKKPEQPERRPDPVQKPYTEVSKQAPAAVSAEIEPEQEPLPPDEPQQMTSAMPTPEKVDTVEFAIAPKPDEPQDMRRDQQVNALFGAGLYDEPQPKVAPRNRTAAKPKTTRKAKAKEEENDLPAGLDMFEGVDIDS